MNKPLQAMTPSSPAQQLPTYSVRVSARARQVRLQVSIHDGVVVVVPRDFDHARIPALVEHRRHWLQKHLQRLQEWRAAQDDAADLPERITLQAIGEQWTVEYRRQAATRIQVVIHPGRRLILQGSIDNQPGCRRALHRWLARIAQQHLAPWLRRLSVETGHPFDRVLIKGQKTRWGSCTRRRTISINYKLLFLPAPLVRYVLLHELCHTVVMNHSRQFWAHLERLEPASQALHAEARQGWRHVPVWVEQT